MHQCVVKYTLEAKSASKIDSELSSSDAHVDKPMIPPEVRRKKTRAKTCTDITSDEPATNPDDIVKYSPSILRTYTT